MVVCLVEGFWVIPVDHQRRHVLGTLLNTIYVAENGLALIARPCASDFMNAIS